jgi:hypothetical protein
MLRIDLWNVQTTGMIWCLASKEELDGHMAFPAHVFCDLEYGR